MINQDADADADTRTRLVEAARRLFLAKGYAATSVAEILSEADAHSGSLYHYFATKQDLLLAVLDSYCEGIRPMLLEPAWRGVGDPLERVFALLGSYRELLEQSAYGYGCPIGSLALGLHEPDPAVRASLAANFRAWTAAVRECLAGAHLPTGADLDELAITVLAVMEGAVMQSRTYGGPQAFDACVRQLRTLFGALRAGAPMAPARGAPPPRSPRKTTRGGRR